LVRGAFAGYSAPTIDERDSTGIREPGGIY
jgi:hypothetical protein